MKVTSFQLIDTRLLNRQYLLYLSLLQPLISTVKCLLVYEFIIAAMAVYKVYEAIKILLFFRNLDC